MSDAMQAVLKLVAEGRLTAEEAGPILDALSLSGKLGATAAPADEPDQAATTPAAAGGTTPRFARIQVMEGGRRVVDLRIPTSLGRLALGRVPGLSSEHLTELQRAISSGVLGPLLEVEDPDGDGVRIVLE
jgi:hypothetical protein